MFDEINYYFCTFSEQNTPNSSKKLISFRTSIIKSLNALFSFISEFKSFSLDREASISIIFCLNLLESNIFLIFVLFSSKKNYKLIRNIFWLSLNHYKGNYLKVQVFFLERASLSHLEQDSLFEINPTFLNDLVFSPPFCTHAV